MIELYYEKEEIIKMYLFQKIEEVTIRYNDARKSIGEFILKQNMNLTNLSMNEIAKLTYTSKSTLVRFAKTLGFTGWNEFMKAYVKEIVYQEKYKFSIDANIPFTKDDTVEDMLDHVAQLQIESITKTKDLIDLKILKRINEYLLHSNRIVIFCVHNNIHLAELFKNKMLGIGKNVIVAENGDGMLWATQLTENDCAILISYSGNNEMREPEFYIEVLKNRNVKMIGITSEGDNYIHNHVDCVLKMTSQEKLYSKIAGFSTEQSIMYLFNVVYSYYFMNEYDKHYQTKVYNAENYEKCRKSILNDVNENYKS